MLQDGREPHMQLSSLAGQEAIHLLLHGIPAACSLSHGHSHDSLCLPPIIRTCCIGQLEAWNAAVMSW